MGLHNKCRMAEQWIKEGQQAIKMTRLSCRLVADQFAAAPGENRRTLDKACPPLLIVAGRESFDAPAL